MRTEAAPAFTFGVDRHDLRAPAGRGTPIFFSNPATTALSSVRYSGDENNRIFTPAAINVPRPRFKGGYDAHTHKRFANGAARERYMDKNNLTLERG